MGLSLNLVWYIRGNMETQNWSNEPGHAHTTLLEVPCRGSNSLVLISSSHLEILQGAFQPKPYVGLSRNFVGGIGETWKFRLANGFFLISKMAPWQTSVHISFFKWHPQNHIMLDWTLKLGSSPCGNMKTHNCSLASFRWAILAHLGPLVVCNIRTIVIS